VVFRNRERIEVKSPEQLELMRRAGLVVAGALKVMREAAAPGVTTQHLDDLAATYIRDHGAQPSFLGYPYSGDNDFPATVCISVNDEIVHGIPGPKVLRDGDLVSLDCGAIVEGWHGDAALTVAIGEVPARERALLTATEDALWAGIAQARVGNRLSDVSHAVEQSLQAAGPYGLVREYVGHGIGSQMHMAPQVPNYGPPGRGPRLVAGMAIAVEPMANLGGRATRILDDGWTVVTADGSRSAHFEHSVAITEDGPWVLTAEDGGAARLGRGAAASTRGAAPA
jgi:methionyl aminopeptidase